MWELTRITHDIVFTEISAGDSHVLALDSEGGLWAWGGNAAGSVGKGSALSQSTPVHIVPDVKFKKISAGKDHSLAIDENGNIWAWGSNEYGKLGDGTQRAKNSPVQATQGKKFVQIEAGADCSLAIDENGRVWAWGRNWKTVPTQMTVAATFTQVAAGSDKYMLDLEGDIWQLKFSQIIKNTSGAKFIQIASYDLFIVMLDEDGNVWAMGGGPLGDAYLDLTMIGYGIKGVQISAVGSHVLVLAEDGTVYGWGTPPAAFGEGVSKQNGTRRGEKLPIGDAARITKISAGDYFTIALDEEGNVWGCGQNNMGQIGTGVLTESLSPIIIEMG